MSQRLIRIRETGDIASLPLHSTVYDHDTGETLEVASHPKMKVICGEITEIRFDMNAETDFGTPQKVEYMFYFGSDISKWVNNPKISLVVQEGELV
jgi:hypothetical protein